MYQYKVVMFTYRAVTGPWLLACFWLVKCYIMPAAVHPCILMMLPKDWQRLVWLVTYTQCAHTHTANTWLSLVLEQGSEGLTTRRPSQKVLIKTVFYPLWESVLRLLRGVSLSVIWEKGTDMRTGQQNRRLVSKTLEEVTQPQLRPPDPASIF